jgi:hypothetical protein
MTSRRPLYLHIGLQKTGTSYLQSVFWESQAELQRQGLDLVPDSKRATFHLMLRVRDRYNPAVDPAGAGRALERYPQQLAAASGSRALTSEESLAPAKPQQIERLMAACRDRDVHLIVTLRDLARSIPSAWQEQVKAGSPQTYDEYLEQLVRQQGNTDSPLWRNKDIPAILDRWEAFVPADRVHIVTVPPSGSDPQALLRRYCSVLDIDPAGLQRASGARNEALGRVQAELLRRVNAQLDESYRRRDVYGDIGKRLFAMGILGPQKGERLKVPQVYEEWCSEVSARYVERLASREYDVSGDPADLMPSPSAFGPETERPSDAEVAEAATAALASLLTTQMTKLRRRKASSRDNTAAGRLRRVTRNLARPLRGVRAT